MKKVLGLVLALLLGLSPGAGIAQDSTISGLPSVTPAGADVFPLVHSGVTSKATIASILSYGASPLTATTGNFSGLVTLSSGTPLALTNTTSNTITSASTGATDSVVINNTGTLSGAGTLFKLQVGGVYYAGVTRVGQVVSAAGGTVSGGDFIFGNGTTAQQAIIEVANSSPNIIQFYPVGSGSSTLSLSATSASFGTNIVKGSTTYGDGTINGSTWFPFAITKFTTNGTFTTPADGTTSTVYHYRMVAAGGGGGGSNGAGASGGGGGAGGYAEGSFTGVAGSTGITITVSSTGGTAGANTGGTGGTGGSSVIGSPVSITVTGGVGGVGSTAAGASVSIGGVGGAVSVGSPTISITGATGQPSFANTTNGHGGGGAASAFGGGGAGNANGGSSGVGGVGISYGSGGGGAAYATALGGVGAGGYVIIERMTP